MGFPAASRFLFLVFPPNFGSARALCGLRRWRFNDDGVRLMSVRIFYPPRPAPPPPPCDAIGIAERGDHPPRLVDRRKPYGTRRSSHR
jgi:hypothetical protein